MPSLDRDHVMVMFSYHHWATDRVLTAAAALTGAQLDAKWGGSFGTGRGLMRHVVGVEQLWLERLNGRSPRAVPDFPPTYSGRDFLQEWTTVRAAQDEFVAGLSRSMLQGELTYTNIKGERWTYRLPQILLHIVNHGTYHRGQLTHLMRDFGLSAPSTDYLIFAEERRRDG